MLSNWIAVSVFWIMLLNYGFIQIKIGNPAQGIPLVYVLTAIGCLLIMRNAFWDRVYLRAPIGRIHVLWAIYTGVRMIQGAINEPYWAIRDASYLLDSFWLPIGFLVGMDEKIRARVLVWIRWLALGLLILAGAYLMRYQLYDSVPIVYGAQGQPIPLFLTISNSGFVLTVCAVFFWMDPPPDHKWFWGVIFPALACVTALAVYPSRSVTLQGVVLVGIVISGIAGMKRARFAGKLSLFVLIVLCVGMIVEHTDLASLGRYAGKDYSIGSVGRILQEVNPFHSSSSQLTSGWSDRFEWWGNLWGRITDSPGSFLFGQGYGQPLIDFLGANLTNYGSDIGQQVVVREPHNDALSLLGRCGLVGVILFLLFQWEAASFCFKRLRTADPDPIVRFGFLYMIGFAVQTMGEPMMSQSFIMIPLFFFEGLALAGANRSKSLVCDRALL